MSSNSRKRKPTKLYTSTTAMEEDPLPVFNEKMDDDLYPPSLVIVPSLTETLEQMMEGSEMANRFSDDIIDGFMDNSSNLRRFSTDDVVEDATTNQRKTTSRTGNITFDGTTVLCQVCGDKASGFHYGVHACEGCKGFFRRSIQQKIQYRPCTKNQQCSILRINRNRCQYCRLKKCIAVGMSRDAVRFGRVPKREKAKILAEMQRASAKSQADSLTAELEDEDRLVATVVSAHMHTSDFTKDKLLPLWARYRQLGLSRPTSQVACPLNPNSSNNGGSGGEDLSERYSPAIRGVVDFAKSISGFHILSQDDQVTLLKAGMFEILLLRLAVLFDSESKSLMLLDGTVFRRDVCPMGGGSGGQGRFLVDSLFDFVERFNTMALNDADIALYCAIVLISPDRPGLRNRDLVEKMQDRLKDALRKVIHLHHSNEPTLYHQLMMKLPDLRTLNTLHQEKLLSFRVDAVIDKDTLNCKSSTSGSTRSRSPQSDTREKIRHTADEANGGASHWSLTCKASDSSPSLSPGQQNSGGSRGSAEAAQFHNLHISPSNALKQELNGHWPAREASSFDSGKGTLSAKASSCSESESEERRSASPRGAQRNAEDTMPTLKRALQAPPIMSPNQSDTGSSLREKHRAVASLLERRPSHLINTPTLTEDGRNIPGVNGVNNMWPVLPQHAAAFWLSSRAAALSGNGGGLLTPQIPPSMLTNAQRKVESPRPLTRTEPSIHSRNEGVYQPATAAISPARVSISPAHSSNTVRSSPKRHFLDVDEQPLNLSKKATPSVGNNQ